MNNFRSIPIVPDQPRKTRNLSAIPKLDQLSVLVYITGNTFNDGSNKWLDPSTLVSFGKIIIVTIQYRLGPFAWLSLLRNNLRGNFGLLDIQMALQWISKNISYFGGNANRVTLMGNGAGLTFINFILNFSSCLKYSILPPAKKSAHHIPYILRIFLKKN